MLIVAFCCIFEELKICNKMQQNMRIAGLYSMSKSKIYYNKYTLFI